MSDISHQWGSDLEVGPTGDLLLAAGQDLGQQRILRRLLTNPGGYLWHVDYGAGLGAFVGEPSAADQVESIIVTQMANEPSASTSPEPIVEVSSTNSQGAGVIGVEVKYESVDGQGTQVLKFIVPGTNP